MDCNILRDKIVEERDKVLFDEAVACLEGGALRAAYITTWISIAESLKLKFLDMSSRDHEIKKKVISKIEDLEQKQRPTDSLLIRSAKDFGLISAEQTLKLEHIKSMRGVYAHPLSAAPTENEVRLAIELSVDIVLSQPALLKHAFVSSLTTSIFENHHYLDDSAETIRNMATSTLNHIHPSAFSHFFKLLIENLDKISNDFTKGVFERRGSIFLDVLLGNSHNNFSTDSWKIGTLLHKYPLIMTKVFAKKDYWNLLDENMKDSMLGHLIEPIGEDGNFGVASVENLTNVLKLYNENLLTSRHIERFEIALDKCSLTTKGLVGVPLDWYKEEFITGLKSSNWYAQNPVVQAINSLGIEKINTLDADFLVNLGRNILQAADGGAREAEYFVASVYDNDFKMSPYLVEGIFLETFINENKKFRFKSHRNDALKAVISCEERETERILDNAIALLDGCSQGKWWILEEEKYNSYLEFLNKILENQIIQGKRRESLEEFRHALKGVEEKFKKEDEKSGIR